MKLYLFGLLVLVVGLGLLALPVLAQGCGCTMPPPLLTEPATPTPTATPFADLGEPPRFPARVWLPLIGGGQ